MFKILFCFLGWWKCLQTVVIVVQLGEYNKNHLIVAISGCTVWNVSYISLKLLNKRQNMELCNSWINNNVCWKNYAMLLLELYAIQPGGNKVQEVDHTKVLNGVSPHLHMN